MFVNSPRKVPMVVALCGALLSIPFDADSSSGRDLDSVCEPRATSDPGRLNIAVELDGYGFVPPCRPNLEFYIARNTPIRSIDVMIRVAAREGDVLSTETAGVDLEHTDYGMFAARIGVDPVADQSCPELSVVVEVDNCRGEGAEVIECPVIRVKAPKMFAGLSVFGENLNICHDD